MDEVWGVARHPGQAPLLQWMVAALLGAILLGWLGFFWPAPPEPERVFPPFSSASFKRATDKELWMALLKDEERLRPQERFLVEEYRADLARWEEGMEAVRLHQRRARLARVGFAVCAAGLVWAGALFAARRPLPVAVRLHQLQVDSLVLPWSEVNEARLDSGGCRVETRDGQVLLEGYVVEDKGALQRAALVAMDHHQKRQGTVPPEMEALRGRLPERLRQ